MRSDSPEKMLHPPSELSANIKGQLNGKTELKEVFVLSHPDIISLMRYVWTGCYLPTTRDDYIKQLDIDKEGISEVSSEIDLLVKNYGAVS
jgi:hypothetical protein